MRLTQKFSQIKWIMAKAVVTAAGIAAFELNKARAIAAAIP